METRKAKRKIARTQEQANYQKVRTRATDENGREKKAEQSRTADKVEE